MLNTAVISQEHRMLWSTPGWLPEEIGIIVEQGQFFCYEGEDLKLHLQRGIHTITVYSLIGMAINIESGQTQKPHLVAMVNGLFQHSPASALANGDSRTLGAGSAQPKPMAPLQRLSGAVGEHRGSTRF